MAFVGLAADNPRARRNWWLGPALVATALAFAWGLAGSNERRGPPARTADARTISQHCQQFVEIAKASFGPNWKPRLDPSDPLCADEIQLAWERQRIPRNIQITAPTRPSPAIAAPPPPVELAPPARIAEPPRALASERSETYCLNILVLAQTKYGDDWRAYITPEEAANCRAHMQRMP